jgi:transcriptional regulator with XRE-family HTH domain
VSVGVTLGLLIRWSTVRFRHAASARINQYERGKHVPDIDTAARLCKVLGVPAPFLYAQDDMLAAWISSFEKLTLAVRRSIARKIRQGA